MRVWCTVNVLHFFSLDVHAAGEMGLCVSLHNQKAVARRTKVRFGKWMENDTASGPGQTP